MSDRIIPTLFVSLSALAIAPFIVPAIAAQQFARDHIDATIHFSADNSRTVGQASETQFVLTDQNDRPVPLSNCNCQVSVHDFRDRAILEGLPLNAATVDGKTAIATTITFPTSGSHTIVLSGHIQNHSEPFEIRFPVAVLNANSTY